MKKTIIYCVLILLVISFSSCNRNVELDELNELNELKYTVYEMRSMPAIGEDTFFEYDLWSPSKYEPENPPLEREIEFDGQIYHASYQSAKFEKGKGTEPILYYVSQEPNIRFGIYENSGKVCYVSANYINYKELYQNPELDWKERREIADRYARMYADVDDYYVYYSTFDYSVPDDKGDMVGDYIVCYTYEYYRRVNGQKCFNDKILVSIFQDGTFADLQIMDVGALKEKNSAVHFDFEELYRAINDKIKNTEKYSKHGDFDYMINSIKQEYYVFEDGKVGIEMQMYISIFPEDETQSSVSDLLVYIIKENN